MDHDLRANIEGVAVIAVTWCEMGEPDENVIVSVADLLAKLGIQTRQTALLLADAISAYPQPEDLPADKKERRRFFEDMVGVTPPEEKLAAILRARELVLRLADLIDQHHDTPS